MTHVKSHILMAAIVLLTAIEFVFDSRGSNGLADWGWYLLPVYLSVYVARRRFTYFLAAVISLLLLLAFGCAPSGLHPQLALLARLTGIGVIWILSVMIAHHKQVEQERRQLECASRAICGCHQVLIHATSEPELLKEICQLIIEKGGFRMCWVGWAEADASKSVLAVARAGWDAGYLAQAKISWSATDEHGRGPTGEAIRTQQVIICNDFQSDPLVAPWRKEAQSRGYASSITLPLLNAGRAFGVLTIYSGKVNAFAQPAAVELLKGLADDLAFGVHTRRSQARHLAAAAALKEREEIYSNIVNQAADSIALIDPETGRFVELNAAVHQSLGYTREEFADLGMADLQAEPPGWLLQNLKSIRQQGGLVFETRHRHRDGTLRDVRVSCRHVHQQDRDYVAAIWHDITEDRRRENELLKLSLAVEQNPSSVVITNLRGDIEYVNQRFTEVTGYTLAEVRGKNPRLFKSGLNPDSTYTQLWGDITAGRSWRGELINRKKDDSLHIEWVTISPVGNTQGVTTHFVAMKEDITEVKEAAAALESERRLLADMVENSSLAIVFKDLAGRYQKVNRRFEEVFGLSRTEVVGHAFDELFPDQPDTSRSHDDQVIASGKPLNFEEVWASPSGDKTFISMSFPIRDSAGSINGLCGMMLDVTDRRQAEAATLLLAALVESSNDAIISKDLNGTILTWNHGAEVMFGYGAAEMVGASIGKLIPPERFGEEDELKQKVLRGELIQGMETVRRAKTGRLLYASISVSPLKDKAGNLTGYSQVVRDITVRIQNEIELRRKNRRIERLNSILRSIQEVATLLNSTDEDVNQMLAAVCASLLKTRGYLTVWAGWADPASKKVIPAAHAGDYANVLELLPITWDDSPSGQGSTGSAIRERRTVVCEDIGLDPRYELWRKAMAPLGSIPITTSIASVPILHGEQVFGALSILIEQYNAFDEEELKLLEGLARDIGRTLHHVQQESVRRKIEESHARLATAVEQSGESIVITDTAGRILYANPAFERTSGYPQTETLGQNPRLLKSGKQDTRFYRQMWDTLTRGESWKGHFVNRRKDGSLYEEDATISPIRDELGRIVNYVAAKRDVTHELKLEAQFREAQKMEAMGTLAGGIAHDFNNILTAIFGYASLLQLEAGKTPESGEMVDEILRAASRAKDLVQQILTFSRHHEQKREVIRLGSVIKEATKFLRASLPANLEIEMNLSAEAPAVLADPTQIYQVVMNLATNALHAMEGQRGRLTIELQAFTPDAQFLASHPKLPARSYTRLIIADTGHGMDATTLQRIFEPFFTTKPVGKGTGLGLAVVHGIVQSHDGLITVQSQPGQGTSFHLYFPAQSVPEAAASISFSDAPIGSGESILVVDDEVVITSMLQRLLKALNYQGTVCNHPAEALRLLQEPSRTFDLVLTDLTMPEMNGLELARKIRLLRPQLPIILASGYTGSLTQANIHDAGICHVLAKPVALKEMARALRANLSAQTAP